MNTARHVGPRILGEVDMSWCSYKIGGNSLQFYSRDNTRFMKNKSKVLSENIACNSAQLGNIHHPPDQVTHHHHKVHLCELVHLLHTICAAEATNLLQTLAIHD